MGVPHIFHELTLHLKMVGTRFHHSPSCLLINFCLCCEEAFIHPICPGFSSYPRFRCHVWQRDQCQELSPCVFFWKVCDFSLIVSLSIFLSQFYVGWRRERQFYFNCSIYVTSLGRHHTVHFLSVSVRNSEIKSWGTSDFGRVASRYPWSVHRDFKMGWVQK